jgi:tetratricopeptide (TPR) repeat protein
VKVETLPPREQALVKNCLTESELYITYHQIGRAIETLEGGLAQVPGNPTLCEHLLPLYEQSEQYEKAASCAEALTEEYVKLGDGERASRYGELTLTLQQKAMENALPPAGIVGAAPSSASASTLPAPELPSPASELPSSDLAAYEPAPPEPAATEQSQVREVDLSMEWASAGTEEASPATAADGTAEEIEFYLQAGLVSEAVSALERLQEQFPSHSAIEGFRERLAALQGDAVPAVETPAAEPAPDAAPTADAWTQTAATPPMVEPAVSAEFTAAAPEPSTVSPERTPVEVGYGEVGGKIGDESVATQPTVEPTPGIPAPAAAESGQEFVFEEISHSPASAFELALEESHAAESVAAAPPGDPLAALAGELGESLDLPEAPSPAGAAPPAAVAATPAVPVKEAAPAPQEKPQGGLLDDIFAEFKEEMEEPAAAGDLETHYNMGVAFKEMALYDEAIGEFQKMHQLAEKAKDYSYLVQCCSLLATCFLEKGLPQLAVKWYQTALNSPGISPETSLALLFEIGSAYEVAGDRQAALRSFMEVYARNIDYRNVAERIRDLQQGA